MARAHSLLLAVVLLLASYQVAFAATPASTEPVYTTIVFLDVWSNSLFAYAGNLFGNLTNPQYSNYGVYLTANPTSALVVGVDYGDLFNENSVFTDPYTYTTFDPVNGAGSSFVASVQAGNYIYGLSTNSRIYQFDANNLNQTAPSYALTGDYQGASLTDMFILTNATDTYLVVPGASSTPAILYIPLTGFPNATAVSVTYSTTSYPSGASPLYYSSIVLEGDYAYLVASYLDHSATAFARVSLSAPQPEIAFVVEGFQAGQTDLFYDEVENILYCVGTNTSASGGATLFIQVNLTGVDVIGSSNYTTLTVDDSLSTSPNGFGASLRWATVSTDPTLTATSVTVDTIGGQVFIPYLSLANKRDTKSTKNDKHKRAGTGGVWRFNMNDLTYVVPDLFTPGKPGSNVFFLGDATSSLGHRELLVPTSDELTLFNVPTSCPQDCGEYQSPPFGTCVAGVCSCESGRFGVNCSGILCTSDCGAPLGQGYCAYNGLCVCGADWTTASNCTVRRCPNDCFGNGQCSGSPDYTCSCNGQWAGIDCSVAAYLACDTFTTQTACVAKTGSCGWCSDSGKCMPGNLDGPESASCIGWYFDGKYQSGLLAAAIIFIVIWIFMLLVGIFSAMPMDYVTAGILADSENLLTGDFLKEGYWRDERSAKTWKMFELFQFISFYAFIDVSFPTQIIQFTHYFNWANMLVPLPYGYNDTTSFHSNRVPSKRSILDVEQYANSVRVNTEQIYYGTLFWFAILFIGCMAIYGLYALFMWLFLKGKEPNINTVLLQKVFYVMTRLVLIGYMPIIFTSAWHIAYGHASHPGTIAAAVITLIVVGILPIVFNGIVVWGKGKELLFLYLKLRFGALYSVYHYEKALFNLVVLARKFIIGCLLGFLAHGSVGMSKYVAAQIFTIVAVWVLYIFALVAVRPYLDQVHLVLDIFMSLFFTIAFGVAYLHKTSVNIAAEIVAGICIILVFLAILLAFIHSWVNIVGRNTYPWILCGPRYDGLEEDEGDKDAKMDTAQQIKERKEKQTAVAGAMPSTKKTTAAPAAQHESDDVDSSLASSTASSEDEEE